MDPLRSSPDIIDKSASCLFDKSANEIDKSGDISTLLCLEPLRHLDSEAAGGSAS